MDQFSPFSGSIVDIMFGNSSSADKTDVFTHYVDLLQSIYSHDTRSLWTSNELKIPRQKLFHLKTTDKRVLEIVEII